MEAEGAEMKVRSMSAPVRARASGELPQPAMGRRAATPRTRKGEGLPSSSMEEVTLGGMPSGDMATPAGGAEPSRAMPAGDMTIERPRRRPGSGGMPAGRME